MKHKDNSTGVDALMSNADAFDAEVERIAAMSGEEVEASLLRMGIQPARKLPAWLREVLAEKELQSSGLASHQPLPTALKNIIAECKNNSRSRTTYYKYFGRKLYKQLLDVLISARISAHALLRNKTARLLAFYYRRENSFSILILSITLLSVYLIGKDMLQPNNKTEKNIPVVRSHTPPNIDAQKPQPSRPGPPRNAANSNRFIPHEQTIGQSPKDNKAQSESAGLNPRGIAPSFEGTSPSFDILQNTLWLRAGRLYGESLNSDQKQAQHEFKPNAASRFSPGDDIAVMMPTNLFTIYDGQTLRKGEFTFSVAWSNYDRDPGDVDITEVPLSFQIGLSDYLELFFNTDGYRGVKVNNSPNLSNAYWPNTAFYAARLNQVTGAFGPTLLQSGSAIVLTPVNNLDIGRQVFFHPVSNRPFGQFPFVGGSTGNFQYGIAQFDPRFTFTLGGPNAGGSHFDTAANFLGIGSVFGSILPGVVLTQRVVPDAFTTAPTYLPDAPFISRLYGESAFSTFSVGAKWRFTEPNNPLGIGLIPFYRFYADTPDDRNGFNQLQHGVRPGASFGDFGLVMFADRRLSKRINSLANIDYFLNSNTRTGLLGNATQLGRPDELIAGVGVDFLVNEKSQPIPELKSVQYVGDRTPNAFQYNPVDFLAGVRIFPRRWMGFSAAYRAHMNQQGSRIFSDANPGDFPRDFVQSNEPHGFRFQFWVGRRNERAPTVIPNNPPTTAVSASPSRVVLEDDCPPGERPIKGCTATGSTVQLAANATDPDGDTLLYTWSTTGGRITGDGANVTWDLSGVQPGTYTASVEVDDGCGCIAFSSTTVTVVKRLDRERFLSQDQRDRKGFDPPALPNKESPNHKNLSTPMLNTHTLKNDGRVVWRPSDG